MPPYTLVESKIANFAHYRRVNGQETDAYSSSRKPRRTLYSLLVQTAIDPQAPCMTLDPELFTAAWTPYSVTCVQLSLIVYAVFDHK